MTSIENIATWVMGGIGVTVGVVLAGYAIYLNLPSKLPARFDPTVVESAVSDAPRLTYTDLNILYESRDRRRPTDIFATKLLSLLEITSPAPSALLGYQITIITPPTPSPNFLRFRRKKIAINPANDKVPEEQEQRDVEIRSMKEASVWTVAAEVLSYFISVSPAVGSRVRPIHQGRELIEGRNRVV